MKLTFAALATIASAQLIPANFQSCIDADADDNIRITDLCDAFAIVVDDPTGKGCDVYGYLWSLGLGGSTKCQVTEADFGDYAFRSHCNSNNLQATYTYSTYPNGDTSVSKDQCVIQGSNIAIAPNQVVESADYCDMVVTVTSSAPLNIEGTTDCWFFQVESTVGASLLAAGLASVALVGATLF